MSATSTPAKVEKPIVLKIVRTEGGYAIHANQAIIHPTAVYSDPFDVLDAVAGWLAGLEHGNQDHVQYRAG